MDQIELFVGLKIPDTTAITTFKTLKKLDYKIQTLERNLYYKFYLEADIKDFKEKISKVDILVNSNKNTFEFKLTTDKQKILVTDIDDRCTVLLSTLKERLGFTNIKKMEKGVLWILDCSKETAEKITKDILFNEHYQKYEVLK